MTFWTPEEDSKLLSMMAAKRSYRDIAASFGDRTFGACKSRAHTIRVSKDRIQGKFWTAQETELAQKLVSDGSPDEVFRALLGRTRQACFDRVRRVKFGSLGVSGLVIEKVSVPDEVIADRNRRLMAPRSLTAALMGDPEPGRAKL